MNLVERLIEADRINPRRILVIGDGMTDVYVYGRIEACQEGCPKFVQEEVVCVAGGAANAARSLSHWHSRVDYYGELHGPIKTRFMVGDKCEFRHDDDRVNADQQTTLRDAALSELTKNRPGIGAVLLSDYDKGMLTQEFIQEVVCLCQRAYIPCVADAKRKPRLYAGAVIKGNLDWYLKYGGCDVVTRGEESPLVRYYSGLYQCDSLPPVGCVNHVGAGDCFAAHLALGLAHSLPLATAAAVAHSAGRAYVQHRHNRPPHPEEVAADVALGVAHVA